MTITRWNQLAEKPDLQSRIRADAVLPFYPTLLREFASRSQTLTAVELTELKNRFCNHSMVGVSKLLHFLNPAECPIWDSRVANVWYAPKKAYPYTHEQPAEYLTYARQTLGWSMSPLTNHARGKIRSLSPCLAGVSDLRLIELVLFHS